MANNVRFYRLSTIPPFVANNHAGLFVYLTTDYTDTTNNISYKQGLWFGGGDKWELLTNVQGITLDDVRNWINNGDAPTHPFNNEIDIFEESALTGTGETGTTYTVHDIKLDSTGLHQLNTDASDIHSFTVGDGALKISGSATTTTGQNPSIPPATTNDVHSANDILDSTLTLDSSLVWTPSTQTIGVRVKTAVRADNPIVTLDDIADLDGAMHLIKTLDSSSDWLTTANTNPGDTCIVTTAHTGPDGKSYEVGDTVVYYDTDGNGTMGYKVVNTNITSGTSHGQHPMVDMPNQSGQLEPGKLVIATNGGITTSNVEIDDIVTDVTSTQTITATESSQLTTATYTVSTVVEKLGGGSDSDTDVHDITFNSLNESFKITEATGANADHQLDFDLVWLTTGL